VHLQQRAQSRVEHLWRAACEGVGAVAALGAYLFATVEALAAEDVAGYGWTTLDGEEVPLLPEEVWDQEPGADEAS